MRSALLATLFVLAALIPSSDAARAAIPEEDPGAATGVNCVQQVDIPDLRNVVDTEWSPDGSRLALVRTVRVPAVENASGYRELEILETLDMRTGHVRFFGEGSRPAWSASGRYISYWGYEADFLIVDDGEGTVANLTPTNPEYHWMGDALVYLERSTMRTWSPEDLTARKLDFADIPHFPADHLYWSGDGTRYTHTRYDSAKQEPERFVGMTQEGSLRKLDLPGAWFTEWSPSGADLLVRYPDRIEIRDGAGVPKASIPVPVRTTHQWGPGGESLLLRFATPLGASDGFEEVRVIWPSASVMKLPELAGPLGFGPDGRHYSGTVRTGRHENRLLIYRCLQVTPSGEAAVAPPVGDIDLGGRRLIRPVQGPISAFMQGGHTGIDLPGSLGSPIVAADDGVVRAAGWITNGGFRVCVTHAAGLETCYFHASGILATVGQRVRRGEPVALVGMSGLAGGPHVHWEARFLGRLTDPLLR